MSSFNVRRLLAFSSLFLVHFSFFFLLFWEQSKCKLWRLAWRIPGCFNFQTTKETIEKQEPWHLLIIAEVWHCVLKTWQSTQILGRTACSCRSVCRTMGVCADFWPEQWQDDMEPDRDTESSRIYTADSRDNFNAAKKHLIFLFPLPNSFVYFGASCTHNSKVKVCARRCLIIGHWLNKLSYQLFPSRFNTNVNWITKKFAKKVTKCTFPSTNNIEIFINGQFSHWEPLRQWEIFHLLYCCHFQWVNAHMKIYEASCDGRNYN